MTNDELVPLSPVAPPSQWESYCWSHWEYEYAEDCHRVCGECGHLFASADDLKAAYQEAAYQEGFTPGSEVLSCPFCVHDW